MSAENIDPESDQKDRKQGPQQESKIENALEQKCRTQNSQNDPPQFWIARKSADKNVLGGVGRDTGPDHLRRPPGVERREKPHSDKPKNEDRRTTCQNRHLNQADEDSEVNQRLCRLAVIRRTEPRAESRKYRGDYRRSAFLNVRNIIRLVMLPKKVDAHYYTILAIGKPFDAMVAGRAQRPSTAVAIDQCRILYVIGAIHYFLSSLLMYVPPVGSCRGDWFTSLRSPFQASALC